ncbi:AAA family ATPase [bacterium]|nr:AAA family ATPase [bacterium]
MQLVWFELSGYKRFAKHTKINLSEKLVAIVGPNEAGKTSLLRCLRHFNHREPFVAAGGSQELTRGITLEKRHTVAEWTFAVDDGDREALKEIPEAKGLRWYAIEKTVDGAAFYSLKPLPRRSIELRETVRIELVSAIENKQGSNEKADDRVESQEDDRLIETLRDLAAELESDDDDLARRVLDKIATAVTSAQEAGMDTVAGRLSELHANESMESPSDRAAAVLSKRQPEILFFSNEDRELESEYDLNEFFRTEDAKKKIWRNEIPIALQNLAHASSLELNDLYAAQSNDDRGRVKTLLERAEIKLTDLLQKSWTQDKLSLSLELDGYRLQLLLRSEKGEYVKVIERSDGLRQFVALLLFLARQPASKCRPIVLIDEVERHLHYDGQADLVQVLAKQRLASKVVYTTHSIGCLPEDLGSGVRMVATEDPHSTVENYFWDSRRPGFSPLLFSMGAQTLAFLPMRYALIAEGAADLILVPAILKATLKLDSLGFQVVPGLSSSTSGEIAILNNESVRTAYLVDGDDAGRKMKAKIAEAHVAREMILELPQVDGEETVIEDYLRIDAYLAAVQEELRRSGCHAEITAEDLPRPNRPRRLEDWCEAKGVGVPSKRAVAYHVVEKQFDSPLVDEAVDEQVRELFRLITTALRLRDQ